MATPAAVMMRMEAIAATRLPPGTSFDWTELAFQERQAGSTAVFSGMLGVTVSGLFLTPVFYVALRAPFARKPEMATAAETGTGEA